MNLSFLPSSSSSSSSSAAAAAAAVSASSSSSSSSSSCFFRFSHSSSLRFCPFPLPSHPLPRPLPTHRPRGHGYTRPLTVCLNCIPATTFLPHLHPFLHQTFLASLQLGDTDADALSVALNLGSEALQKLPEAQRWQSLAAASVSLIYLTARPGVLIGAIDAYVLAPLQLFADSLRGRRRYKRSNFLVEQRIGEGSFGIVFSGLILPSSVAADDDSIGKRSRRAEEFTGYESFQKVILKKVKIGVEGAEECGEMEEWFNYRMSRAAPDVCADFLGSFVADTTRGQFTKGGKWLVWKFEGNSTLQDFIKDRNFPENLTEAMFGTDLKNCDPLERKVLIITKITRQIITSLKKVHDTGIVHRDIKPSNLVITNKGRVKLIDFGAATDLRIGKNYVPNRTILDPDYCPPELYVMPEETPKPPPAPVAAALSPFIWQFNSPDLFDMYSVGVILMQMACPTLRTPAGLQTFKSEIQKSGYDLRKWREDTRLRLNLEILDYDGAKGWDLATKLICERGFFRRGRLSAASALRHPYFLLGRDQTAGVLSKLSVSK